MAVSDGLDLVQVGILGVGVGFGVVAAFLGSRAKRAAAPEETARVYLDGPIAKIIESLQAAVRRLESANDLLRTAIEEYKRRDDQAVEVLRSINERLGWRSSQSRGARE